jgi:hypothetical protein
MSLNAVQSLLKIVYYVMRSKNDVLCAAAGRLAAERSEADKPAKAHKTIFCSTLSEFENFLLCERILINVTTCQNETSS